MGLFSLLLFIVTLAGGSVPLWLKTPDEQRTNYLLAFSGSFLLSITLLHLLPETFELLSARAGIFLLTGFFLQLFIQRITHGIEHGHAHFHTGNTADKDHNHAHIPLFSMLAGLSLHAFMEGLPLGFHYRSAGTASSLYLAVAAHKLPEAMLLTTIVARYYTKKKAFFTLLFFSLVTPFAAALAVFLGEKYFAISKVVTWLVPIVAGAFIHISTTIFFESGTRQHKLIWQKLIAIMLGVGIGLTTLLIE